MKKFALALSVALFVMPLAAHAEKALGVWHTQPDSKDQTAHVSVVKCGDALCGTMVRAYDKTGKQIAHKNVGKRLFWDVKPTGKGDYKGRAYVPIFNKDFPATMTISGNVMTVKGCGGPVCKSQHWSRVK